MNDRPRILVVGSHAPGILIHVRRVPVAGETVLGWDYAEPQDGGKGSNQAIAAARLGAPVSFVGCVGKDRIGDEGNKWLEAEGVDTRFLFRHPTAASGIGFIMLDEQGVPAMVTAMGANAELRLEQIEAALNTIPDVAVLLVQFEIPVPLALAAARLARTQGITTIVNPAPAPAGLPAGLDAASLLVPNETEALNLLELDPNQAYAPIWLAQELQHRSGVATVVVTLGANGAAGCDAEGCWHSPAPQVSAVDTSGAGDAFCAALAVAITEGIAIREATAWACTMASASVMVPGTIPAFPTRARLLQRPAAA